MKTTTRDTIVEYIRAKQHVRPADVVRFLGLSPVAVHRQLKRLVTDGVLTKPGSPPLVFYTLAPKTGEKEAPPTLPAHFTRTINDHFLFITPDGKLLYGMAGFTHWARLYQPQRDFLTLAGDYAKLLEAKGSAAPQGWIDATEKIKATFHPAFVDRLLFADTYSYPVFGRTKLAKLVMHAKQSESTMLMRAVTRAVKPMVENIIATFRIDAVAFIPPTVPRRIQFMDEFASGLDIHLPHLDLAKVIPGDIPIPQKSLPKLEERIVNARSSIFPKEVEAQRYARVLLIDDVVGSGASFQETSRKLKALLGEQTIIAFAVVGNIKGYEVIRQL